MVKMNGFAAIDCVRQLRYVADKVGKAQKCLPTFIHFGRNTQLAEVRKYRFHTWQAGHQGTLIAFLPPMSRHTWQAMHRGASMRLRSFYNTRKQCLCIYTGENSVFLVGQHPKPFNNFSAINESDCVEIWLRTVPALMDIYEERHRRIFLRLCLSE